MQSSRVNRRTPGQIVIENTLVDQMKSRLPAQTKDAIMMTLGVSANTWVKIKRGEPIRLSTAQHLLRRLEHMEPR